MNFCHDRQPLGLGLDELEIVVGKSNRPEPQRGGEHKPDVGFRDIGPEERREDHGEEDENPAHGGRAALRQVMFGAVAANLLAQLHVL